MALIRSFVQDNTGSSIEKFSVAAGLIALSAIAGTHVLATWSRYNHMPILATLQAPVVPAPARVIRPGSEDQVDYAVTGAIARTVLEPCSGKIK